MQDAVHDVARGAVIRVGAVDDHPVVLHGLSSHLAGVPGTTYVGGAASVLAFTTALEPAQADVVLLDLDLDDHTRPAANVEALLRWGARVLVWSDGLRHSWMREALGAGAHGVLLKAQPLPDLLPALRRAHRGEVHLAAEVALALRSSSMLRPQLAPREVEVLVLAAQGERYRQIAHALGIGEETVKTHLKRVRAKYADVDRDASTRIALRTLAEEDGYLDERRG